MVKSFGTAIIWSYPHVHANFCPDPCWVKYLSERVAVILDSAVFEIRLSPKLDFEGL